MVDFCFRNVIAAKKGVPKYQTTYNQELYIIVPIGNKTTYRIDITFLAITILYRIKGYVMAIYNVDENGKRWIT